MNKTKQDNAGTTSSMAPMNAVCLFALLAVASIGLAWVNNEFVITKEVFRTLAGNPGNSAQADAQYEAVQSIRIWGYVMAPLQTAFRIGLIAMVVQVVCLIGGVEIKFATLFRIASVAFGAVLFGSVLQILWIVKLPATANTRAALGIVPDSVAAWVGLASDTPTFLYLVLSRVSFTSLLWMLLVYWGLSETKKLRPGGAATVTTATWLIVSTLQVGTTLFMRELIT